MPPFYTMADTMLRTMMHLMKVPVHIALQSNVSKCCTESNRGKKLA